MDQSIDRSIFPVRYHADELIGPHALDAQVPVTLVTPPTLNPLALVKASDAGEARGSAFDFVAGPATRVIRGPLVHGAVRVRSRHASVFKLDILHKFHGNGGDLLVNWQVGKIHKVKVLVDSGGFLGECGPFGIRCSLDLLELLLLGFGGLDDHLLL